MAGHTFADTAAPAIPAVPAVLAGPTMPAGPAVLALAAVREILSSYKKIFLTKKNIFADLIGRAHIWESRPSWNQVLKKKNYTSVTLTRHFAFHQLVS